MYTSEQPFFFFFQFLPSDEIFEFQFDVYFYLFLKISLFGVIIVCWYWLHKHLFIDLSAIE